MLQSSLNIKTPPDRKNNNGIQELLGTAFKQKENLTGFELQRYLRLAKCLEFLRKDIIAVSLLTAYGSIDDVGGLIWVFLLYKTDTLVTNT